MKNSRGATINRLIVSEAALVTDKVLVTAVTGKKIYIHQMYLDTAINNNTITFKSGATAISPDFYFASKGDIVVLPLADEVGWFVANGNLTITSLGGFTGFIMYTQE
jgi:hypothetical protein